MTANFRTGALCSMTIMDVLGVRTAWVKNLVTIVALRMEIVCIEGYCCTENAFRIGVKIHLDT